MELENQRQIEMEKPGDALSPLRFLITDYVGNRCREHPSLFLFRPSYHKNQLWSCILRSSGPKQTPVGREGAERDRMRVCALSEFTSENKIWVTVKGVDCRHSLPQ